MRGGGRQSSLFATPALIGAVTVLIVIVAVVLAYNANKGLPFVPTYNLTAELPGGANLVAGNDVRVGGFRVGLVEKLRPGYDRETGRSIALVDMKLEKKVEPLPVDTSVFVRPRSNLGLKYVELTVGNSSRTYDPGATIPIANARKPIELDEFFSTFNRKMRQNQQTSLEGFGNALAGRGQSINQAIEELVPFFTHLTPVMTTLSDPRTRLNRFFVELNRFSGQIAPVAQTYATLFTNMATTFEALSRDEEALRQTIERSPPTLDAGIRSFPVQRPFLADSERLFRHLEPAAAEFERSLPTFTDAIRTGQPVLRKAPALSRRTQEVFEALIDLTENPNTLLGLRDLTTTVRVLRPLLRYFAPYQTVCNYWVYYWTGIGEHVSEPVRGGTLQRSALKSDNRTQDNRLSSSESDRPADVPSNLDPKTARDPEGNPLIRLQRQAYLPAIDAQGNADCQIGQSGSIHGPFITGSRYEPSENAAMGGGSHVIRDSNFPWLSGPTYQGVRNLSDVP
jgi:virulence factor Mce-like protein